MTVETNNNLLTKLSIHEIIQKHQILELYSRYWGANVALKPHINMADIQSTLEDSAEIVARVRSFTDKMINKDHLITLRLKDGQANDFLFNTEISPENKEEFLRELVYATLKIDSNSFESGVSKEIIDSFIDNYLIYKKQLPEGSKFDNYSFDNLSILLSEIQNLSNQIFEQKSTDNHRDQKEDKLFLKSIIKSLESIYLDLFRYSASSQFVHVADTNSDSSDLSDIDDFVFVDNVDEKIDDKTEDVISIEQVEEKKDEKIEENNVNNENNENNNEIKNEVVEANEEIKQNEENQPVEAEIKEESSDQKLETKEDEEKEKEKESTEEPETLPEEVKNETESNIESTDEPKIDLKSSGIIKIAKVESNIENTINEINQLRESVNSLEIDTNEPKLSLKKVEELLRKCLFWGEALMKDLLTLDTISTEKYPQSSEIRPLRKKKAVQIQTLMDEIEQIKSPLKKHQSDLSKIVEQIEKEQKEKEKEREKEKEAEKNNSANNSNASTPDRNSSPSTPVSEEKQNSPQVKGSPKVKEEEEEDDLYSTLIRQWKLLKLDPQFETEKQRGRYIITASIPGMKDDEFKLKTNEREGSLTISGCRLPSRADVELLKKNLLRRYKFPNETELTKQLFRYGINRFGTFNTSFSLPNNVITSKIEAKYESGILYIIIPVKVQHAPQYQNPYSRGYNPYFGGSNYYSPNNFFY